MGRACFCFDYWLFPLGRRVVHIVSVLVCRLDRYWMTHFGKSKDVHWTDNSIHAIVLRGLGWRVMLTGVCAGARPVNNHLGKRRFFKHSMCITRVFFPESTYAGPCLLQNTSTIFFVYIEIYRKASKEWQFYSRDDEFFKRDYHLMMSVVIVDTHRAFVACHILAIPCYPDQHPLFSLSSIIWWSIWMPWLALLVFLWGPIIFLLFDTD